MEDPRGSHTLNLKEASTLTEAKAEGEGSWSGPHNELWQTPNYNLYLTSEPVLVSAERPCSPGVPSGREVSMPGYDRGSTRATCPLGLLPFCLGSGLCISM